METTGRANSPTETNAPPPASQDQDRRDASNETSGPATSPAPLPALIPPLPPLFPLLPPFPSQLLTVPPGEATGTAQPSATTAAANTAATVVTATATGATGTRTTADTNSSHAAPTELRPYRIELNRHGDTTIKIRTNVRDTQSFKITLLRSEVRRALRSFRAVDSRGTSPTVVLPSPVPSRDADDSEDPAWRALLSHHRGSSVHIKTPTGTHSGRLLGIDPSPISGSGRADQGAILLEESDSIAVHTLDDPTFLSIKVDASPEKVEAQLPRVAQNPFVAIVITANGTGLGTLNVSYEIRSAHKPAYDLIYRLDVPGGTEKDARHSNARLRCTAVVPNPTHIDLHDVELCLITTGSRSGFEKAVHKYGGSGGGGSDGDSSSTSSGNGRDDSDDSSSDTRSGHTRPLSDVKDEACDIDSDALSTGSQLTESDFAWDRMPLFKVEAPNHVSINTRQSAVVPLFHKPCEAGLTHFLSFSHNKRQSTIRSIVITNTTDSPLEPGGGTIAFSDGDVRSLELSYLMVGEERYIDYSGECGVSGRGRSTAQVSDVTSCSMEADNISLRVEWERSVRFDVHNKDTVDVDVIVEFVTSVKGDYDSFAVATLYDDSSDVGREDVATRVSRCDLPLHRVPRYLMRLQPGMRRVLVVKEKAYRDQRMHVLKACTPRVVTRLRKLESINTELMATLRDIVCANRSLQSLRNMRKRHRRKIRRIKSFADREADGYWSPGDMEENGEHDADRRLQKYFRSMEKAEECISKLREECDRIEKKIVEEEADIRRLTDLLRGLLLSVTRSVVGE